MKESQLLIESRRKIHTINYIINNLLIGQKNRNEGSMEKKEERNVLRKLSCNTQKKIVNPSSFLPVIFSILGFHVKISVFICLPIGILYHFRQVSLSLVV